jgi:hypothetical protein
VLPALLLALLLPALAAPALRSAEPGFDVSTSL